MFTSYNPTARGLADAIIALTDIVKEPLTIVRTPYGYHIATLSDARAIVPPCPSMVDLYDEVLCANIL